MERRKLPEPDGEGYSVAALLPFWTPLCAVALSIAARSQANWYSGGPDLLEVWLFGATAFTYHFTNPVTWIRQYAWSMGLLAALTLIWLPWVICWKIAGGGIAWVLYFVLLRKNPWWKPILVAGVWVGATLYLALPLGQLWPVAVHRFGLVFALALGYDVLDRRSDAFQQTPTLVLRLGGRRSFLLALLVLVLAISIAFWGGHPFPLSMLITGSISMGILYFLIQRDINASAAEIALRKWQIDGVLLLQALLELVRY